MSQLHKLTHTKVKGRLAKGRHSDGGGLYLNVSKTGSKSWVFIFTRTEWNGNKSRRRSTEIGLGSLNAISLSEARERAALARNAVANGENLKKLFKKTDQVTFETVKDSLLDTFDFTERNPKTEHQWRRSLNEEVAALHRKPIQSIDSHTLADVIKPIWSRTPETGRKLRARLEKVFDHAKARGWYEGENPARMKGALGDLLPVHAKTAKTHFAAMSWKDVPDFMQRLGERDAISAKALTFLILTATRTSETLNATWDEINLSDMCWTIPAERMKMKQEHVVPLSSQALSLLEELSPLASNPYIFPGNKPRRPLSNMAMLTLIRKRMGITDATPHGFRSSFRDWCGDGPGYPRELAEMALAHTVGGVEGAYRRGRALERRRVMMEAWGVFCMTGAQQGNVVALHG